jgi:phosphoribosylformylglycinamidine synthase
MKLLCSCLYWVVYTQHFTLCPNVPVHVHSSWIIITINSSTTINDRMAILHYYRKTEPLHSLVPSLKELLKSLGLTDDANKIETVETESCFNIQLTSDLSPEQVAKLEWLLAETFDKDKLQKDISALTVTDGAWLVEFGPRMTFTSAFSSNAVSICRACDIPVERCEKSRRFLFSTALSDKATAAVIATLHDKMTEQVYHTPCETFDSGATAQPVVTVPIMSEGRAALERINTEKGLGFDEADLVYYTELFQVIAIHYCSLLLLVATREHHQV